MKLKYTDDNFVTKQVEIEDEQYLLTRELYNQCSVFDTLPMMVTDGRNLQFGVNLISGKYHIKIEKLKDE